MLDQRDESVDRDSVVREIIMKSTTTNNQDKAAITVSLRNRSCWLSQSSPLGALFSPLEYGTQLPDRKLRNA